MRAFKCDNCGDLVAGIPRHAVVAKVGGKDWFRIAPGYLHETGEPELCDKCLLEVMENALVACRAYIEKEDDDG